jgi:hypothetical protein
LKKLLLIDALAFCLMGFWLIPLLAFLPYTTRFSILWIFFSWDQILREVLPVILYPFMLLSLVGTLWMFFKHRKIGPGLLPGPLVYVWFIAFPVWRSISSGTGSVWWIFDSSLFFSFL